MADVEISYNNSVIASLSAAGSEVLETNQTFLTDDITVTYAGGNIGRLVKHEAVTFTTTATSDARQTVMLEPGMTNYYITVIIDARPSAPDASEYIALQWHLLQLTTYGQQQTGMILRPNGTIGTDGAACVFTASTGALAMGGPYGHFMAGTTYHIYQFEIGAN